MKYNWNWGILFEVSPEGKGTYLEMLLSGLVWTLTTAFFAWIVALTIGVGIGVLRTLPSRAGRVAGDAYVELKVEPHAFFEARDNDIHIELPVTITEATLGGKVRVPTVGGAVMLNVPAGSNTGTSLRLKGRGLLDRKSGQRGDQYVKLKVTLPDQPDAQLKEFLEKWEAGRTYDPRKAMEQFT